MHDVQTLRYTIISELGIVLLPMKYVEHFWDNLWYLITWTSPESFPIDKHLK